MSNAREMELETLEQQILNRLSAQERSYLTNLLRNVVLFIKRMQGEPLTKEEKLYPPHPMFAHFKHYGGKEAAEILQLRLQFIDRYQLCEPRQIEGILTFEYPTVNIQKLTARKAHILHELYENPIIPKYKLAKKIGTTPRTITKEIRELKQEFAYQIITTIDSGKFNLVNRIIAFRSKSIQHSEQLEEFFRTHYGFFRMFQLDRDMRKGGIVFRYPNQPDGHKMFEERCRWLQDRFFVEHQVIQVQGYYYSLSLATYDPETNAYSFEPGIVSEAPFSFVKQHLRTLPQPKGFLYEEPIPFDRADFLLAHFLYNTGNFGSPEFKQGLLKRHSIELSKKTIWKREQQLRERGVSFPIVDMQIPGFDDQVVLFVFCSPDVCITIRGMLAFLPYIHFFKTNTGCILRFQRPARTSELTGHLIRILHREPGVSDVKLLRYQWRITSPLSIDINSRWDKEKQHWNIQEGDI